MNEQMTHTIKHHINDAILMAYSAGTLPEAFNLMVASHLSLCDGCRSQAASFDAVGGEVLEQMTESHAVSDACLEATMALIAGGVVERTPVKDHPRGVWTLPPTFRLGDLDRDKYLAIGESDRMTLKFLKPAP